MGFRGCRLRVVVAQGLWKLSFPALTMTTIEGLEGSAQCAKKHGYLRAKYRTRISTYGCHGVMGSKSSGFGGLSPQRSWYPYKPCRQALQTQIVDKVVPIWVKLLRTLTCNLLTQCPGTSGGVHGARALYNPKGSMYPYSTYLGLKGVPI